MVTITDTIAIAIITIAIVTIAITISPTPNAHTYTHNRREAGTRLCWKIWVRDLLSPRSNWLPFLQSIRLELSTPWPWGIVRCRHGGRAIDMVQTMISTNIIISATAICFPPPATRHPVPGACNSAGLWIEHPGADMGAYSQVRLRVSCLWRVYLGLCSGVSLRASWELTWERTVKQAGSVSSSAIRSVLCEHARECTWERTRRCTWEGIRSVLGCILRAYLGAIVKQAGSVPSSAIGSVLDRMLGSVLESVLRAC